MASSPKFAYFLIYRRYAETDNLHEVAATHAYRCQNQGVAEQALASSVFGRIFNVECSHFSTIHLASYSSFGVKFIGDVCKEAFELKLGAPALFSCRARMCFLAFFSC